MNPLAAQLNQNIQTGNEHVYQMLSLLGKEIYFKRGDFESIRRSREAC